MNKKRQLENITSIETVPTQFNKRTCTDVFCLIFGIVFSLIMIITAIATFNYKKFVQANFPSDSNGTLCGIDSGKENYQYVYFVNPPDISRRVCVQYCPRVGDQALKCIPTDSIGCRFSNSTGFEVMFYDTEPTQTRSGYFCYPKDENLRQKILQNSNLTDRQLLYKSLDTIIMCIFVALGFSILYMLAVQFFPKIMNYVAIILGSLIIIACIICLFTYGSSQNALRIVAASLLILVVIVIVITFIKNTKSIRIHGIFLSHATKFIRQRLGTLIYIPLFFLLLLGFITLIVLEFNAFWTSGDLAFSTNQGLFYKPVGTGPTIASVFLGIQAFWGLVFLKMAFNFCVSGEAVLWYYSRPETLSQPIKLLICKHLGSVIGGSFIIGFFTIFDFIFDLFKPDGSSPDSCYSKCYNTTWANYSIFDLVRTDSMAYINLTGNPYCNSARYCQYLCDRSVILDNSQSTSRVYRLCAHFLLCGIMLIFAMYVKGVISTYALIIIAIDTIFVSTLFISVHADATEAISMIFLADQQLSRRNRNIQQVNDYQNRTQVKSHLQGIKMHHEIAEQIKSQRLKQIDKINDKQLNNAINKQRSSKI